MHTSIVITRSRSREVAKQVAATKERIRACYPNLSSRTGQAKYLQDLALFHRVEERQKKAEGQNGEGEGEQNLHRPRMR